MQRRLSRTLKSYGRITIPNKLLKQAKKREVYLLLDNIRYVFEPDKYGRVYIPPEIREKVGNMSSYEVLLTDGELQLRFRRF
jgi:bifunctional DNA-binding transcriptional regulator/antitoxin component of YhaV-PrlF toxin-antitoxin module